MSKTTKECIRSNTAPAAIGCYSPAVKAGNTIYVSGQIGLNPNTMKLVSTEFIPQTKQALENLKAIVTAAGATLDDIVKLTVYLTDMSNFDSLNQVMQTYLSSPYPARAAIEVKALPKGAVFEVDAILITGTV